MGLGGSANSALDAAVNNTINIGVHFVIPAGSSGTDAGSTSSARVAAAVTVGAVKTNGRRANFSNYGSAVDIYALGVSV
jgi:cerevisin